MDWTSVFDESGDEDFLISQQLTAIPHAPRLARLVSKLYHQPHAAAQQGRGDSSGEDLRDHHLFPIVESRSNSLAGDGEENNSAYTLQALYYLSINYILGVGCLGIPYAFARAGFLLCTIILGIVTLSSYMTVMWVAETGERYHSHFLNQNKAQQQQQMPQQQQQQQQVLKQSTEESPLVSREPIEDPNWDRYEVVDLVGHYLGPLHKMIYQISLMALMYIGLLAYSQVFCSAVAELLESASSSIPGLPQIVFGIMVIPLSCVELDEQISVQSIMAVVRFVAIFAMVFGAILALLLDDSNTAKAQDQGPPYWAPPERKGCQMSYSACVGGFGVAFSTSLFSQLFQHSVPGLLRPLRDQPSKHGKVPKTFGASLLTTLSFYLLLGMSAASFFGAKTRSSVNLNFANFTMGLDPEQTPFWLLAVVKAASSIVVIFPALDTISVFPLIANTLGNNLYSAAVRPSFIKKIAHALHAMQSFGAHRFQRNTTVSNRLDFGDLQAQDRKLYIEKASKTTTILWRLVAALPPLLGSLVAADLSFSFLLAGLAGVYVAFFAPSLLQLKSVKGTEGDPKTIFQGWFSSTYFCYPVLAFATFSLGAVILQIKGAWTQMQK